jgi:hypothetical protein
MLASNTMQSCAMNLTTRPIIVTEENIGRPEFIRLPKPGKHDPFTGLSRSALNILICPCKENDFRPLVRSCTLRRKGTMRGVRLVDYQSLMDYINSHVEPTYVGRKPQVSAAVNSLENGSLQKLTLDQSLRVIISLRIEKETDTTQAVMANEAMNI